MHSSIAPPLLFLLSLSFFSISTSTQLSSCLQSKGIRNFTLPSNSASAPFDKLLTFSIQNLRFAQPSTSKPSVIIFPLSKDQLQNSILCLRQASLTIRVRSGGHSYEGLSYTSDNHTPFGLIDLANLNRVWVDPGSATAWVESGATLGEIYYNVAVASNGTLAFSAGSCSTVGSGGHISGGGFGVLSRTFGLAADNVLDAILIDPNGQILDSSSMDSDVFWAIRGGGGGSFGVVYAWKLQLKPIPNKVSLFFNFHSGSVVPDLVYKWQSIGPNMTYDFYLSTLVAGSQDGYGTVTFMGLYLGSKEDALYIINEKFPELGVNAWDITEKSWIETAAQLAQLKSSSDLTNRTAAFKNFFKAKSDYVQSPISRDGIVGAINFLNKQLGAYIILDPYGGVMSCKGSTDLPFPHRAGTLYGIQYTIDWNAAQQSTGDQYMAWLRDFYTYMGGFVSKNPRAAYVNYLDLDLGTNNWTAGTSSSLAVVNHARIWGESYFGANYDRLVQAKTKIDPTNVFNNAQSIPPLPKS
ncbi:hypothetical protein LUZ60_011695 [Juncus effusus]|nr:hypothetical protein LUZ60_011695 [Juncus effusus]